MPPLWRSISSTPPASIVMMMSSPIPVMPRPMPLHHSSAVKLPAAMPMSPDERMPSRSTFITFMPQSAVTSTSR